MNELFSLEWWEMASYVVTVIGLPLAIFSYFVDQRRERRNEDEEIFQYLSEEYAEFQKLAIENSDLRLNSLESVEMTPEQLERKKILYDVLISLFERAYMLVYEEGMDKQTARMWASWEDYMRYWCRRVDFRAVLPEMLEGEDPDFVAHMTRLADETAKIIAR